MSNSAPEPIDNFTSSNTPVAPASTELTEPIPADVAEPASTDVAEPASTDVAEPATTEVAEPIEAEAMSNTQSVDPITGNGYTNTSNGNQVAVLSTIDYSTNTIIYNYQLASNTQEYNSTTNNYQLSPSNGGSSQTIGTNPGNQLSTTNSSSVQTPATNPGDQLSGAPGNTSLQRNGFHLRFESRAYFRTKGIRRVDRIMGFDGSNGDKLELSRRVFKGIDDLEFKNVSSSKQLRRASKTDADIIYHESANRLYFNANAEDKGFGANGGLFAIFEGEPLITADQFILI